MSEQATQPETMTIEPELLPHGPLGSQALAKGAGSHSYHEGSGDQLMQFMMQAKDLDMTKLEKFIELYERDQASKARAAFYNDFPAMKAELPMVVKGHYNDQTKSRYAKLDDINQAVDPILGRHGFGTSYELVAQDESGVTVKAILSHKGGHSTSTVVRIPLDDSGIAGKVNKTLPHATASSITYGQRTGLKLLLGVSTGEDTDGNGDADPAANEAITTEEAADIDTRLRGLPIARAKYLTWLGVEDVRHIKRRDLKRAVAELEQHEKKKAAIPAGKVQTQQP